MSHGRDPIRDVAYRAKATHADGTVSAGTAYATRGPAKVQANIITARHATRARAYAQFLEQPAEAVRPSWYRPPTDPGPAPEVVIERGVMTWEVDA